jgi:hypothetical protein
MRTYFGILKEGVLLEDAKKELLRLRLRFVNYFSAIRIVQFESVEQVKEPIKVFTSFEEERNDFGIE